MKIFVSSLIGGFEDERAAAVAAITSLGHIPITAETFGAGIASPRVACLQGLRDADLVVLMLGEGYGAVQDISGLSATHEEYREAKDSRPVIAFVQEGIQPETRQAEFIREVQDWAGGLFRDGFTDAEDLRKRITQAIHQFELANAVAPVDPAHLLERARTMIPREERGYSRAGRPLLHLAVVGGPAQTILRPVEIERPELSRSLLREANYGDHAVFDSSRGSSSEMSEGALHLTQDGGAEIILDEQGGVRISVPIARGKDMVGALIEENLADAIDRAITHADQILSQIDETHRLSRFVIVASIDAGDYMGWRTRREDEASPNSMTMSHSFRGETREPVSFLPPDRPRTALTFDKSRMVEDLVTLLRRQWQ